MKRKSDTATETPERTTKTGNTVTPALAVTRRVFIRTGGALAPSLRGSAWL